MTSVRDILVVTIILFVVGITMMFTVYASHIVNDAVLNQPFINDSAQASQVLRDSDAAIDSSDYLYLAFFIGIFISIIVAGWFVGGIPIFSTIYFVLVCIFTFVAVILQIVWVQLDSQIMYITADLPITNFILSNLGYFCAVFGLVGILVMYAKPGDYNGF